MALQLDDLAGLDAPAVNDGKPMLVDLSLIDEDPGQPRTEFAAPALAELAHSMSERGVLSPISVRPHPDEPARWMLNFGARRVRACRAAGIPSIPAFVDSVPGDYDQVVENEQREGLTPIELAVFVGKRLAAGESQAEIARRMGKSRSYVTYAAGLIDAPDWLMEAYRSGKCRGLRELYELRRMNEIDPGKGEELARSTFNRSTLRSLSNARETNLPDPSHDSEGQVPSNNGASRPSGHPERSSEGSKRLMVLSKGRVLQLSNRVPEAPNHVFVVDGTRLKALPATELQLLGWRFGVEGNLSTGT